MTEIERHSRWLLLAYPRWYRRERGDEIVDTLLAAVGTDRPWPSARDTRALMFSGLRVRAGLLQRLTVRASLTQAFLLAAVLVLAAYSARDLGFVRLEWGPIFPSMLFAWVNLLLGLATLAVMIGAWFGPAKLVAVVAVGTACLWAYQPPDSQFSYAIEPMALLLFIAVIVFFRQRLVRSWLWLAAPWYLVFLATWLLHSRIGVYVIALGPFIILAATIAWCLVEVRPMLAVVLSIAVMLGGQLLRSYAQAASTPYLESVLKASWLWEAITAVSIALAILAIWRVRRQALL